jgi:hypothetical protein
MRERRPEKPAPKIKRRKPAARPKDKPAPPRARDMQAGRGGTYRTKGSSE